MKNEQLHIRISAKEKKDIQAVAKKAGFDTISSFFLWMCRQYKDYKYKR